MAVGRAKPGRLQTDAFQLRRDRLVERARRRRLARRDALHHLLARRRLERAATGQQLVKDHAKAVDIRTRVNAMAFIPRLLGAHVGDGADEGGASAHVLLPQRQAEIDEHGTAARYEEDVARLDVAVDEAALVCVLQRQGDVLDNFDRLVQRHASLANAAAQIDAIDQLRDDETLPGGGSTDVIDGDDAGMIEPGEDAGLFEEGLVRARRAEQTHVQHLDGDPAAQLVVERLVDDAEAQRRAADGDNDLERWRVFLPSRGAASPQGEAYLPSPWGEGR